MLVSLGIIRGPSLTNGKSIDLTMATRVHLVEPGWNPMLEKQAMDRIYRLGQQRQVEQTRYVVAEVDSVERVSL